MDIDPLFSCSIYTRSKHEQQMVDTFMDCWNARTSDDAVYNLTNLCTGPMPRIYIIAELIVRREWAAAKWVVVTFPFSEGEYQFTVRRLIHDIIWTTDKNVEALKWLATTFPRFTDDFIIGACLIESWTIFAHVMRQYPKALLNRREMLMTLFNEVSNTWAYQLTIIPLSWMLNYYTADEFWNSEIQAACKKILNKWAADVAPRRRQFMAEIAPELVARRR